MFGTRYESSSNCFLIETPKAYVLPRLRSGSDCNANGIFDACEIGDGISSDLNGNAVPDECENLGDINGDGMVSVFDLLALLGTWGSCFNCEEDINRNGEVSVSDLLIILANWG